jgi:hypothetical protein
MAIENRNLEAGTRLVVRHKKQEHTCEVVKTKDGLRYRLADGKEFNSPSSAGREITGGVAVNGWRFWSIEGTLPERKAKAEPKAKSAKKAPAKKAAKAKGKKTAKKGKGKSARAATKGDAYGCGACGETFGTMKAATQHALTHTTA